MLSTPDVIMLSLNLISHCCSSFKMHFYFNLAPVDFQRRRYVTKFKKNSFFILNKNKLMISNGPVISMQIKVER